MEKELRLFTICLVGISGVGKSAICAALCGIQHPEKYEATIQDDYWLTVYNPSTRKTVCRLHIVDTAGLGEFSCTLMWPLRSSDAVVYVVDVSSPHSLEHCRTNLQKECTRYTDKGVPSFVLINKTDINDNKHKINSDHVLLSNLVCCFFHIHYISAQQRNGVIDAFSAIVHHLLDPTTAPCTSSAVSARSGSSSATSVVQSVGSDSTTLPGPLFSFVQHRSEHSVMSPACDSVVIQSSGASLGSEWLPLSDDLSRRSGGGCSVM